MSPSPASQPASGSPHGTPLAAVPTTPSARAGAGRLLALLVGAALLPRLVALVLNENWFGDAVVRTELAERWLESPHWIASYGDGAQQFGPLHVYLQALFLKVLPWREHAGRVLSLVVGVLAVVPLFRLTRRHFGERAAVWATLAFSAWGLHIQTSSTGASEALALCLMLLAFDGVSQAMDENRFGPLFWGAVALNLACATRYDAWLYIPLLTAGLFFAPGDRVAAVTKAVLFAFLCLPFPLVWMQGNELAHGSALYPIMQIEYFHWAWAGNEVARYSSWGFRALTVAFWPAMALVTLSPLVALLGFAGMRRAWKEQREVRWLVLAALVPAAYYTFRSVVLLNFVPLARFTLTQLALVLPFVWTGFRALAGHKDAAAQRRWKVAAVALAVVLPVALGAFTFRNDARPADTVRPVSPLTTNRRAVMSAARFVQQQAGARDALVLDDEPQYLDVQLGFYTGLPDARVARLRWETFHQDVARLAPAWLVRFDGGSLVKDKGVTLEGRTLTLDGAVYEELDGFEPPVHVYRRKP